MNQETLTQAWEVLQDAYQAQMDGDYDRAVELYQSSLDLHPTAEAHTFLGWTYHFQGRIDEAIAECKRAIELDPDFGNPYNDIGAYLIEQERYDEAIDANREAAKNDATRGPALFNLACEYALTGARDKALAAAEDEQAAVLGRLGFGRASPDYGVGLQIAYSY